MSFTQDFIDKFTSGNYLYEDKKILMNEINKMTYSQFFNFVKSNFTIPYIVEMSLKVWFTMLTKKCSFCDINMNITQNGSERHHYKCDKCHKTDDFNNYDINDYAIYKFIDTLKI
jgi:hypothetical protein